MRNQLRWPIAAIAVSFIIFTSGSDAFAQNWEVKGPIPRPRILHGAAAIDGKLYLVGGVDPATSAAIDIVDVYDTATDSWSTVAPLPTVRLKPGVAALDGRIYAIGGEPIPPSGIDALSAVERYDPLVDRWTSLTPIHEMRIGPAGVVVDGVLYVVGGGIGAPVGRPIEEYEAIGDSWISRAPVPTFRDFNLARNGTSASLNGEVYYVGGQCDIGLCGGIVEIWDPQTDTWRTGPPFSSGLLSAPAAGTIDGRLYVVGGELDFGPPVPDNSPDQMFVFDPVDESWAEGLPMPTPRVQHAATVIDGKL